MATFPTPHGDKLKALIKNAKLPTTDLPLIKQAIVRYEEWLQQLQAVEGTFQEIVEEMVLLLNQYKQYIDLNLIFDSNNNFLYRQKGQLKLDNTILEEFLTILVIATLSDNLAKYDLSLGPTTCFSGIRFESDIGFPASGGGMKVRAKDHDFAISRKLFISASHNSDFQESVTKTTNLAYVAAECKTNLDKTMFQEAAATALDIKAVVPGAKYYLLCEWLDMTPISTSTTAIDEIIILRKSKRLPSNIRAKFNTVEGRRQNKEFFANHLTSNPFKAETFSRFLAHIRSLVENNSEKDVLEQGYF